jgi:hypothetical protein
LKYHLIALFGFLMHYPFTSVNPSVEVYQPDDVEEVEVDSTIRVLMEEVPTLNFYTGGVELHEGCTDSLVYPGGGSGPTISCGLDIGNAGSTTVREVLSGVLSDSLIEHLMQGVTVRGTNSTNWIKAHQVHLGQHNAILICNRVKQFYWRMVRNKYPNLEDAPDEVKSAMLDLVIQTGTVSKRLNGFGPAIEKKNWLLVGKLVANSCSDFSGGRYNSIHRRRVNHGELIRLEITRPKVEISYD